MSDNTKLLEVDFIQQGSPNWYGFLHDAMFADVDFVCEQYDFTDEIAESDLVYTTHGKANKLEIREIACGSKYLVMVDRLDNIAIYKKVGE